MRIHRTLIAVCLAPMIAAGCAGGGGFRGYGDIDRSALRGGPPQARAGACYAEVVKPPVVRSVRRSGGERKGYRKVTKTVTERVGGGQERTLWVSPNRVPSGARVLAERAKDGMLLVVVGGGKSRLVKRQVTEYVPVRGGEAGARQADAKQVSPARAVWAEVVCDRPEKAGTIKAAQLRLAKLGYYNGAADGRYNRSFNHALSAYQAKNRLAVGGFTRQTARKLGVRF